MNLLHGYIIKILKVIQKLLLNRFIAKFLCVVFLSSPVWASSENYRACQDYANNAVNQQFGNMETGCGFSGPEWNENYSDHFNWCMRGENIKYAQSEYQKRQRALTQCDAGRSSPQFVSPLPIPGSHVRLEQQEEAVSLSPDVDTEIGRQGFYEKYNSQMHLPLARERSCQDYANSALIQQQANLETGCGFNGSEWNENYSDHFNWCMRGKNLKYIQAGQRKRQHALAQCDANKFSPVLKDSSGILDRTKHVQFDQVFLQAVDQVASGLDKKIRDIQDKSWNRSRNLMLDRFHNEVKAASYYQKKTFPMLPERMRNIEQTPELIGEIDKQTGEVRSGGSGTKSPQVCDGVRYNGPPRISHILASTQADGFHVTPGDKLIIFGENFYNRPGRIDIKIPQAGGYLSIPLRPGNMNDWSRSWLDQIIIVDVPKLTGLFDDYQAELEIMITHPCSGQKFSSYSVKLTPRMVLRQISGSAYLKLAENVEKKDKWVDTIIDRKNFVKVSHYPGCGVEIPVIGAMTGSGEEGDDYFFKQLKLPPKFTIKKAYLIPKLPGKDWGGVIHRAVTDALNTVSDIASGNIIGAAISLGGLGVESLIKWFDPSVGKYGLWVTERPPKWLHYRLHWNNTCYKKSPRYGQVLEYVGSFLVMGPVGLDPAQGVQNTQKVRLAVVP